MRYRVIQCYTGSVGSRILKLLLENPNFEVVGVLVSGSNKHGRDIGELVGLGPVGLKATMDFEEILATPADAACWNGFVSTVPGSPTEDAEPCAAGEGALLRLIRSGKNVYSGTGPWYLPGTREHALIEEACEAGEVSFCSAGNIPGLISDALPLFVSGYCGKVSRVWCKQADHVADHPSPHELKYHVGLGLPVGEPLEAEDLINELYQWSFSQSAHQVAHAMGVELDEYRLVSKEVAPATEDILIGGEMLIKKGTVGGARWTFGGFVNGEQWYTLIIELTGALGLGEGWRRDASEPQWTVRIEGSPSLEATMGALGPRDSILPVLDLNAGRAVGILPYLCQAPTGFRNLLDLPFITANYATTVG